MSDEPQLVSIEEQKEFITRILASPPFKRSRGLPKLLRFLFDNRERQLSAKDIEVEHFGHAILDPKFKDTRTRVQISELKGHVRQYEAENPNEALKLELPNADDAGGYQIKILRLTENASACRSFWAAHLELEKQMGIICDPLLFFWDPEKSVMFRFVDTNIEGLDRAAALKELSLTHEKEHKESLIPSHLYIDVGTVAAAEMVRDVFRSAGRHVPLVLDKPADRKWLRASPVVIGNVRTNSALKILFKSSEAQGLAYRLDEERYTWTNIRSPNQPELKALKAAGAKIGADGSFPMPSPELSFGIVTRMRNPWGSGAATFISSDGTFTVKQIALALTEESQLRAIFSKMGWWLDKAAVPDEFEIMFRVRLWPGGMQDEGSEAELICSRPNPH